jgi:hypothetical protein
LKKILVILLIALDLFFFINPVKASTNVTIYEAEKELIDNIVECYQQLEENPYCSSVLISDVKKFADDWGRLDNEATLLILAGLKVDGESGLNAIENMIVLMSLAALCTDILEFRDSMLCDWANWEIIDEKHPENG